MYYYRFAAHISPADSVVALAIESHVNSLRECLTSQSVVIYVEQALWYYSSRLLLAVFDIFDLVMENASWCLDLNLLPLGPS